MDNIYTTLFKTASYPFDTYPGFKKNLMEWEKNKKNLKDKLATLPNWDEKDLKISFPIKIQNSDLSDVIYSLRYSLFDWRSSVADQIWEDYPNNKLYPLIFQDNRLDKDDTYIIKKNIDFQKEFNKLLDISILYYLINYVKPDLYLRKVINNSCACWYIDNFNLPYSKNQSLKRLINRIFSKYKIPEKVEKNRQKFNDKFKYCDAIFNLSINPIDYLTMSNSPERAGWHSCHTLDYLDFNSKCYQTGTLSYMNDKVSAVAYITLPDTKNKIPYKICRAMVFFNKDYIFRSKVYPDESFIMNIDNNLNKIANFFNFYTKINDEFLGKNLIDNEGYQYPDTNYSYDFAVFCKDKEFLESNTTVGTRRVYCIKCGEKLKGIEEQSSLICDNCDPDPRVICDCCGDLVRTSDIDEDGICSNCRRWV